MPDTAETSTPVACPWPTGTPVWLAAPANPAHPRSGQVGTVEDASWCEPRYRTARDGTRKLLAPGRWLLWVRFAAEPTFGAGWWARREPWAVMGVFDGEVEKVEAPAARRPAPETQGAKR